MPLGSGSLKTSIHNLLLNTSISNSDTKTQQCDPAVIDGPLSPHEMSQFDLCSQERTFRGEGEGVTSSFGQNGPSNQHITHAPRLVRVGDRASEGTKL